MKYTQDSHIENLIDVVHFFEHLLYEKKLSFHPDDDFSDYVKNDTNEPYFTESEVLIYNRLMNECFEICEEQNIEIYSIGLASMRRLLMPEVKDFPFEVGQLVRIKGAERIYKLTKIENERCFLCALDNNSLVLKHSLSYIEVI